MKRITTLFLACLLVLNLLGCSKEIDPASQIVIDEITELTESTEIDFAALEKAKERYNSLTDEQKKQVTNYADLLKLEDKYEEAVENAKKTEEYLATHYSFSDFLRVSEALGKTYTEDFDESTMTVTVSCKSDELNDLFWGYINYLQDNFTYKYDDSYGSNIAIDSKGNIIYDLSTAGNGIRFKLELK